MDGKKQHGGRTTRNEALPRLLGISGSLRKGSFSGAILHAIGKRFASDFTFNFCSLAEVPAYNEDLDREPASPAVACLRHSILESDGVIIATPEYNHGIPGVLKNALDWASRPAFQSSFRNKPVLIISSGPGALGGVRAQYQLRETLISMLARVIPTREIVVANVHAGMQEGE
jgi:chromate reductase